MSLMLSVKKGSTKYAYQKAFTLIEVMAAVAVFTISSVGLYTVTQQSILLANRLENKTIAHWVALNTYARLDLETELSSSGLVTENESMAGIEWQVEINITETPVASVRRVLITVSDESNQDYAKVDAFIGSRTPPQSKGL